MLLKQTFTMVAAALVLHSYAYAADTYKIEDQTGEVWRVYARVCARTAGFLLRRALARVGHPSFSAIGATPFFAAAAEQGTFVDHNHSTKEQTSKG